ncbi:16461_t:CDS:2 [Rhizophagus irregularis]|nr:16461_t:CDS:2 [Rhizophagus irregularis]
MSTTPIATEPTGLVHIFIDNPNIEIEGKQLISNLENVYEDQLYIDYGRLLKTVLNGRQIGDNPVIVGSCPPTNDSIWRELENLGCQVTVFDQNELGASISDAIQEHKRPGIIVVVSGDGDYRPVLRRALLRDWIVEIWFWDHGMSQHCKWINVPYRPDLQTRITYLDSYYTLFMYAYGRENSRDKKFLEINGDAVETWGNEQVMECYMNLNTFCWWYKPDGHSFHMYFDNLEQWREAKCWVKKIYPEVHEFQKGRYSIYTYYTIDELGDIPLFCPSNYPYKNSKLLHLCQIRIANLICMWIMFVITLIATIIMCVPEKTYKDMVGIDNDGRD